MPRPTSGEACTGWVRAGLSVVLAFEAAAGEAAAAPPAPAAERAATEPAAGAAFFFLLLLLLGAAGVCDSGVYFGSSILCGAKDAAGFFFGVVAVVEGGLAPAAAATAADAKRLGDAGRDFDFGVTAVGCSAAEFAGIRPVLAPLKRPGETGRGFTSTEAGEPTPAPPCAGDADAAMVLLKREGEIGRLDAADGVRECAPPAAAMDPARDRLGGAFEGLRECVRERAGEAG